MLFSDLNHRLRIEFGTTAFMSDQLRLRMVKYQPSAWCEGRVVRCKPDGLVFK